MSILYREILFSYIDHSAHICSVCVICFRSVCLNIINTIQSLNFLNTYGYTNSFKVANCYGNIVVFNDLNEFLALSINCKNKITNDYGIGKSTISSLTAIGINLVSLWLLQNAFLCNHSSITF